MVARLRERLIALAVIGALLFNYPLLSIAAVEGRLFGLPVFYLYLFTVWLGVIALVAFIHRAASRVR